MQYNQGHQVLPEMALSSANLRVFHKPKLIYKKSKGGLKTKKIRKLNKMKRKVKRSLANPENIPINENNNVKSRNKFGKLPNSLTNSLSTRQRISRNNENKRRRFRGKRRDQKNKRKTRRRGRKSPRDTKVRITVHRQLEIVASEDQNEKETSYDPRLPSPDILDSRLV